MYIPIAIVVIYFIVKLYIDERNNQRAVARWKWEAKQPIQAKTPELVVVEKYQNVGPSVLTTKEFKIPVVTKPIYQLPIVDNPTEWFIGEWGIGNPSPAELLIITELDRYYLDWHREISFRGLILASGGYARFDFLLPLHNCIIEYDSKKWHSDPARIENDQIKSEFCRKYKFRLIRLSGTHYYKMEQTIADIMNELNVKEIIVPF